MQTHSSLKPRLLDTFCKAGGCTKSYQHAGFYVVGVDIEPQPHYCGDEFRQADALDFIREYGHEYDVIHASPPCQRWSESTPMQYRDKHPDLITPTRKALQATNKPYVIENVENARAELTNPVKLCGTMFGLPVWRHRYFEIWPFWFMSPASCQHNFVPVLMTPAGSNSRRIGRPAQIQDPSVVGIDWMSRAELSQAIPPAYTEWIGLRLREILNL